MKKIAALGAAVAMLCAMVGCLAGCSSSPSTPESQEGMTILDEQGSFADGWQLAVDAENPVVSPEALGALQKAQESYGAMTLEPLVELGRQVVAGTNYAILCEGNLPTEEPARLVVAVVYLDLDGNAEIVYVSDFDFAHYAETAGDVLPTGELAGGWTSYDFGAAESLSDNLKAAFELEAGASYEPVACLAQKDGEPASYAVFAVAMQDGEPAGLYLLTIEEADGALAIAHEASIDVGLYAVSPVE